MTSYLQAQPKHHGPFPHGFFRKSTWTILCSHLSCVTTVTKARRAAATVRKSAVPATIAEIPAGRCTSKVEMGRCAGRRESPKSAGWSNTRVNRKRRFTPSELRLDGPAWNGVTHASGVLFAGRMCSPRAACRHVTDLMGKNAIRQAALWPEARPQGSSLRSWDLP